MTAGFDLAAIEAPRVVAAADAVLGAAPVTVTAVRNPRSAGGPHDFSSEGDYWWPNPDDPDGPDIRRDGLSNPDAFNAHRALLIDFARRVGWFAAAYRASGREIYARAAVGELTAWFVDPATRMAPHLAYAQAIRGVCTGRGIGLIDTVHLAEVALALGHLKGSHAYDAAARRGIEGWFAAYLAWFVTHPHGVEERDTHNNHAVCWALQAAAFARATGAEAVVADCRRRFRDVLLPGQMAADGSLPAELARTKPYGYSIFTLDVLAAVACVVSTRGEDCVGLRLADGRGIGAGVDFLAPYLADKTRWPYGHDVMHWPDWPVRSAALLLAGLAEGRADRLALWRSLPADSDVFEIRRNWVVRNPTLWPLPA